MYYKSSRNKGFGGYLKSGARECITESIELFEHLLFIKIITNDSKLISSETGNNIVLSEESTRHFSKFMQDNIRIVMIIHIVNRFEAIKIQICDRESSCVLFIFSPF